MKHWKKVITTFTVIAVSVAGLILAGCGGSGSSSDSESTQIVTVTRGTLMTSISSFGSVSMPEQAELTFGSGGRVIELNVKEGDTVEGGQELAKLDSESLISLQEALVKARNSLQNAEEDLETARNPYTESDIAQAEVAVANARVALETAQENLETARNPYTEAEIADAEAAVARLRLELFTVQVQAPLDITEAEDTLEEVYATYTEKAMSYILGAVSADEYEKAINDWERSKINLEVVKLVAAKAVRDAEDALAEAEETLAEMMAGADPLDVEHKRNQIIVAQANLAETEETLANIMAGADPFDIELRELDVASAQAALEDAQENLEGVNMVAPFDGMVVAVNAGIGDEVTANKVIIHLVDPSVVELIAAVDEIDVVQVTPGLTAMITVDGLPNARLRGQVTAVSLLANSQSGVVTYPIAVEIINPEGMGLRDGMSATIEIVSLQAENVLLVPSSAVRRTASGTVVEVATADGETEERVVETGVNNGMQTEIVSGLEEGEQVVVHSTEAVSVPTQQFPGGGDRGTMIPGMGGGGGGFRPPM